MLPLTRVPETIAKGMEKFRKVFCRDEGFEHVSRYLTGQIVSPNKTLQGIYDLQVWEEAPSRRAMHEAVFEARWDSKELIKQHRCEVAKDYQAQWRKVISLDWTLCHHQRGEEISAMTKAYHYVAHRTARFQTVITAVVSNRELIDGLEIVAQDPKDLKATAKGNYQSMSEVEQRLLELLHYRKHELEYRKRTKIALEIVRQIEGEGEFPETDYAFDNGVLTLELTKFIEDCSKHWVSELECSRHIKLIRRGSGSARMESHMSDGRNTRRGSGL